MPRAARAGAGFECVRVAAACFDSPRISFCASVATARGRRRGAPASCDGRFVSRTRAALPGAALRRRCVAVVRCVCSAGKAGESRLPHGQNGPDSDVIAPRRVFVTHSKRFASFDSYDATDVACRGNPSCMTVAGSRLHTVHCTDKSCGSRRRKAFRKMRDVRFVSGTRREFAIHRTTSSDGSRERPEVCLYRARPAMQRS